MLEYWRGETLAQAHQWPDAGLVREGLRLWEELGKRSPSDVLLATDLHAGNVLRSEREPWLVIDPKPFVGDRAYDVVQHLHNCEARLHADPLGMVKRLANLCEIDTERLQLWIFSRAAADPRPDWSSTVWDVRQGVGPVNAEPLGVQHWGSSGTMLPDHHLCAAFITNDAGKCHRRRGGPWRTQSASKRLQLHRDNAAGIHCDVKEQDVD